MKPLLYIAVMALVTYAIRAIPFVAFRKKIRSRFVQDFLYYVPYAVLSAMTIPSVLYATEHMVSAAAGAAAAVLLAFFRRGLLTVALSACGTALVVDLFLLYLVSRSPPPTAPKMLCSAGTEHFFTHFLKFFRYLHFHVKYM